MTDPRLTDTRIAGARGIDRSRPISFTVDGQSYSGFAGDTIASALIAAGRVDCGNSTYLSRARGILGAGIEESNALVRVKARVPGDVSESMLPATRVAITEGLEAEYLAGLGILDPGQDELVYEHKHVHTDVLVVGAGPAGLAAARRQADPVRGHCCLMTVPPWRLAASAAAPGQLGRGDHRRTVRPSRGSRPPSPDSPRTRN